MNNEENNIDSYKVSLINSHDAPISSVHKCSFCFLSSMSFITLVIGLFTMVGSLYIFVTNTLDITYGSELFLMISGAATIMMSILLLISVCNYNNAFAKFILFTFSTFAFIIFAICVSITIYIALYFNSNGLVNVTEIDNFFNESMHYTYEICCNNTNSTEVLRQVCYDVMGHNETMILKECSSFSIFENDFLSYIHNILKWVLSIGGIVAIVNMISGITSCCLIAARKRIFYYKNPEVSM